MIGGIIRGEVRFLGLPPLVGLGAAVILLVTAGLVIAWLAGGGWLLLLVAPLAIWLSVPSVIVIGSLFVFTVMFVPSRLRRPRLILADWRALQEALPSRADLRRASSRARVRLFVVGIAVAAAVDVVTFLVWGTYLGLLVTLALLGWLALPLFLAGRGIRRRMARAASPPSKPL